MVKFALYITLVMRQLLSSRHWPFSFFFFQVASVLRCGVVVGEDFFVVVVDDAAHVRHAVVADFHVVLVKDGVQLVVWWEVFLD